MVSVFLFKFESFLVFLFEPGPWLWGVWHHNFFGHSHWGIGKDVCFHCFGQRCSEKSRSCWIQCGAQRTTGTSRFAGHGGFHGYHKHAGPFNEGAWPVDLKKLANPPSWIFEFDQKVLTRRFDSCTFCNYLLRQDDIWKMRWLIQTTCIALGLEVLVVDSATWHINVIMKLVMRSCLNLSSFCQQLTRMIQYCLHSKVIKVSSIYSLQVERLQPPKTNTEPDKWSVAWEFPFSKRPQFSRRTFPEWKSWIFPRKKLKMDFEHTLLGGGFKWFLFSPLPGGKWSNLTNIYQMGWNHQLASLKLS